MDTNSCCGPCRPGSGAAVPSLMGDLGTGKDAAELELPFIRGRNKGKELPPEKKKKNSNFFFFQMKTGEVEEWTGTKNKFSEVWL